MDQIKRKGERLPPGPRHTAPVQIYFKTCTECHHTKIPCKSLVSYALTKYCPRCKYKHRPPKHKTHRVSPQRKTNQRYYDNNRDKVNAKQRAYYHAHPDKFAQYRRDKKEWQAAYAKEWYKANKIHLLQKQREYNQANRDKIRAACAAYYQAHKREINDKRQTRKAATILISADRP